MKENKDYPLTEETRRMLDVLRDLAYKDPNTMLGEGGFDSGNIIGDCGYSYVIDKYVSELKDDDEVVKNLNRIIDQAGKLQAQVFNYLLSRLERKEAALIARCKEIENEILTKKELDKQMTFSAREILDITSRLKIRGKTSKNTVYSHLSKGLLKGTQDDLGNWTVKREDLEKYLNRTDF